MPDKVSITINGQRALVPRRTTIAAAILSTRSGFRKSVSGEPRAPVCGMGICFECRATVNGQRNERTCQRFCKEGMVIGTDE